MDSQTAFGGMLQHLVELTSLLLHPEPLDGEIERRCEQACEEAPCPECGETAIQIGDSSPHVWCTNCSYVFTYTPNTPFEGHTFTPGEIVIAFVLSADTLLSIHHIRSPSSSTPSAIPSTPRFEKEKPRSKAASLSSGNASNIPSTVQAQIDETGQKCSGYKGQTPPRERPSRGGSGEGDQSRWDGAPGDTMTIIGAYRDTLRVLRAELGAQPEELNPALDEVEILSGELNEVWHDG